MTTSILETNYIEPDRPYSQKELGITRHQNIFNLRLSNIKSEHNRCSHFYLVKKNWKKEKQINDTLNSSNGVNFGNCSVCWKLSKTPTKLQKDAINVVKTYSNNFYNEPTRITHCLVDIENIFYTWLYEL